MLMEMSGQTYAVDEPEGAGASHLTISKDLGRVMSRLKGFCKGVMKDNGDRLF